jgi:metal-responsive CopG/Arc/MetJ family transcriptional regulator
MKTVDTEIALPESLLKQAEAIAKDLQISQNHLVAIALEEFIRRYQDRQLFEQINAAYSEPLDEEEELLLRKISFSHRRLVEREPWQNSTGESLLMEPELSGD